MITSIRYYVKTHYIISRVWQMKSTSTCHRMPVRGNYKWTVRSVWRCTGADAHPALVGMQKGDTPLENSLDSVKFHTPAFRPSAPL